MGEIIQKKDSIENVIENKKMKSVLLQTTTQDGRMKIVHSYLDKKTGRQIIKEWIMG